MYGSALHLRRFIPKSVGGYPDLAIVDEMARIICHSSEKLYVLGWARGNIDWNAFR